MSLELKIEEESERETANFPAKLLRESATSRLFFIFLQRCNACYYAIKAIACVSRGSTCLLFHVEKTPKKTVAAADKTELIDFLFIFS